MVSKVLQGHTSPETAYLIPDYPFGFRLRCQMRVWIETRPGKGQRVVSQTTNPKVPGTVWNKPKASTYSLIRVLFLDEQGHVQNDGLHPYAGAEKVEAFATTYADGLTDERSQKALTFVRKIAARMAQTTGVR